MDILSQVDEASVKVEAARKEMKAAQKVTFGIVKQALKELAAVEGIEAFRWRQWTPGFNDGDACEFTIDDLQVRGNLVTAEHPEDEDDEGTWYSAFDIETSDIIAHERMKEHGHDPAKVINAIRKIASTLNNLEELLEDEFGNNIQITVTKKGIETEEYDCGY